MNLLKESASGKLSALACASVVAASCVAFSAPAQGCCGGPSAPKPGELAFVSHVHGLGFPGISLGWYHGAYGQRVELTPWPGLNQQDSNILYAGYGICSALAGAPADWDNVNMLLGGTYRPTRPQIDAMLGYAHTDLGCG